MNNKEISADLAKLLKETPKLEEVTKELNENPIDFDNDPDFVADYLKATFINDVIGAMKDKDISKTALADKLGKSKQYVGRIINETTNYTIETISAIACALEQEVVLTLKDRKTKPVLQEEIVYDEEQKEVNVIPFKLPQEDKFSQGFCTGYLFSKTLNQWS